MRAWRSVVLAGTLLASACSGPTVDLRTGSEVQDVATGWFDAGITNGQNRLVPTISFKFKNVSNQKLVSLQVNAIFRRVEDREEWGSAFLAAVGSEGLASGETTPTLTLKSQHGYTGPDQSRQEMLQNSKFVDAKVELFAKYAAIQWTRLGEFPIARQLITK